MNVLTRHDRIRGGIYGLLIGDALGVPYEFNPPEAIPPMEQIEMKPPEGFRRTYPQVAPGTWSDDGAQALCLLASLLHAGRLEPGDLGNRFVNWLDHGYMAVGGQVFDCGVTTSRALAAIRQGVPAVQAGPNGLYDNGNGSLMRVLPLALWHSGTDKELVLDAHLQSRVTHGHTRSQVCCALYCLWARRELNATAESWTDAVATLRQIYIDMPVHLEELESGVRPEADGAATGSGYVVDALRSAKYCLDSSADYEGVVKRAVALGKDTDTTAAIAGGMAGVRYGFGGIPPRWVLALLGKELMEPLVEKLSHGPG